MTPTNARVSFNLSKFSCSPSVITSILGVEPTRAGERGEAYVTTNGRRTDRLVEKSYWSVWSSNPPSAPLQDHFDSLGEILAPVIARLGDLPEGTKRSIYCTQIWGDNPELIVLRPATLAWLAELGADVTLDVMP